MQNEISNMNTNFFKILIKNVQRPIYSTKINLEFEFLAYLIHFFR
jgi:hypothetical protein